MDSDTHMFNMFFAGAILFSIGIFVVIYGNDVKSKMWNCLGFLLMAGPVIKLIFFFLFD